MRAVEDVAAGGGINVLRGGRDFEAGRTFALVGVPGAGLVGDAVGELVTGGAVADEADLVELGAVGRWWGRAEREVGEVGAVGGGHRAPAEHRGDGAAL